MSYIMKFRIFNVGSLAINNYLKSFNKLKVNNYAAVFYNQLLKNNLFFARNIKPINSNLTQKLKNQCLNNHCEQCKIFPLLGLSFGFLADNTEKDDEKELEHNIKLAILAIQKEEYDKAEQLLHLALKFAQDIQHQNGITYIYDLMANLAYQQEKWNKAEELFVSVLKRLISNGISEDDNSVIEISLKLATILANKNEFDKAIQGFLHCITSQQNKLQDKEFTKEDEDTFILWAMSMDWFARFLIRVKEYKAAKDHFLKAYKMCKQVLGPQHHQTAVLLNDIGTVCSLMGEFQEASTYMKEAIEIGELAEVEDLSTFYVNLGMLQIKQKVFDAAKDNCLKGWKLATKVENEDMIFEAKSCIEEIEKLNDILRHTEI